MGNNAFASSKVEKDNYAINAKVPINDITMSNGCQVNGKVTIDIGSTESGASF